jgi:hypothetical protein
METDSPASYSSDTNASARLCAICQSPLEPQEPAASCPHCRTQFHEECWQENGGCAIYGCSNVPAFEPRSALDIPSSYWGQDNKPCPACGVEILAAAARCRHCGATFSSGRAEERAEFQKRAEISERLPSARRNIVVLFVLCVIPCAAPLAALIGAIWYWSNQETVRALPSLYGGLCKIALGLGIGQTVLIVIMVLLFSVFRVS